MQLPNQGSRQSSVLLMLLLLAVHAGCVGQAAPEWAPDASTTPGRDATTSDTCEGIDCGELGTCVDLGADPSCDCVAGTHAEGLTCVPDVPPEPCDGVTCGDNAYCSAGDCLCEDGFEGDAYAGCTSILSLEDRVRAELVDIAWAELGYCEGQDVRPYMLDSPGYWCYDFVGWVYDQSSHDLPSLYNLPRRYTWNLPSGWRPKPGDLIKFNIQHYGMVAEVSADGQTITTIEGNYSSCVKSRDITDHSVSYYGTLENAFY